MDNSYKKRVEKLEAGEASDPVRPLLARLAAAFRLDLSQPRIRTFLERGIRNGSISADKETGMPTITFEVLSQLRDWALEKRQAEEQLPQ